MKNPTAERIRNILGDHTAPLVAAYFDPDNRFAGATFDLLEPNPPNDFTASDILATSLLDVPFLPLPVRSLLGKDREKFAVLLAAVPTDVDLWEATDEDLASADPLWWRIRDLDGIGPTRTSKLMARKRPRLIPVVDSLVEKHVLLTGFNTWVTLRDALAEDSNALVREIEAIRPVRHAERVSTLRLLDAALWMNLSGSKYVKPYRAR